MKLLILHASAGGGHRRAAEALAEAACARKQAVTVRDILDFVPPLYRKTYGDGYLNLVRAAPELWGYLYAQTDRNAQRPLERRIRSIFNRLNALSFYRFLAREAPDAAVCTHFLPLELIATQRFRRRPQVPLYGVVTDFAAHALWYVRGVDIYYVASEEARRQLMRDGQAEENIRLTGIPVMQAFAERVPAAIALRRRGLPSDRRMVLVLSGGCGIGPTVELLRACVADPPPCQLVIVAGRNAKIERAARALAATAPIPVTVFGFVDFVHELMDAADVIISKPGGLTSAEAMAKGKPLIIVEPIPGQEQRNCEHLLEAGCAVRLFEPADAPWKIRQLLSNPRRLTDLAANAARIGRPAAAGEIIADVIRRCT